MTTTTPNSAHDAHSTHDAHPAATSATGHRRVGSVGWAGAVAFEWTKLAGIRSTWWIIAVALVSTVLGSWMLGASLLASGQNGAASPMPAPMVVVQTMIAVEFIVVLLGTFAITSEYSTGSIMSTLQAVPGRARLLLAKVTVQFVTGGLLGAALILVGTPVAAFFAADFGTFDLTDLLRAAAGVGLGLGLLNVLVLGLGTALRSAALTILTTLGLLQLVPSLLPLAGVEAITDFVQYMPNAAISVLAADIDGPYSPGIAILVLLAWAVAGTALGYLVLRNRDA